MSSSQSSSSRNAAFQFNNNSHTQQQQKQQQSPSSKVNGNHKQQAINNLQQNSRSGIQNYFSSVGGGTSSNSKTSKKDSPNLINQLMNSSSTTVQSQHHFHLQGPHAVGNNNATGKNNNNLLYNNNKSGLGASSGVTNTATNIQHGLVINSSSSGGGGNKKRQSQNNKALLTNGVHKSSYNNNNHHPVQKGRPTIKSQSRLKDTKGSSGTRNDSKTTASHNQSSAPQTSSVPIPSPTSPSAEKSFKTGDDVLFNAEDGSMVFGTVGMIHGQTLQILFGDGTQQWAHFKRVTNFSACVPPASAVAEEEECPESLKEKGKPSKYNKTANSDNDQTSSSEEVTCGSCGTVKRVAGKKALNYHPFTSQQFNCRRCLNKSSFSKNSMIISPASRGRTSHHNSSAKPEHHHQGHGRLMGDMGEVERRSDDDECFHCKGKTSYNDRLHCNLCERACHLSCLAISPTPLEGDRFWDVICSACGTQNGDSGVGGTKVFSCRRSISSWSDVAHLVLSCLGIQQAGERYFDLDLHVIPFIDSHMDRLHLPRSYKTKQAEDRKTFLRTALNNAKLRFVNIQDSYGKLTLWAIRDNNNHQGYPYRSSIPARPPSTSPHQSFQSSSSSNAAAPLNKVQTPQSSPLLAVGVGNSAKSKLSGTTASSSSSLKSQSSPSKLSCAYSTSNNNDSNSADIQSRIMASIPKTILNAKHNRNGTVVGAGGGGAFSSVTNLPTGSGSGSLSSNVAPSSTTQPFRQILGVDDHLAAGSSRTLGKGSPKKILPPNLPGVTLTSVTVPQCANEVDPKALDTAVEQSRQVGVKRPATTPSNLAFRKDISISVIRPDEDSNTNSTESENDRVNTDTDSDSNQNGLKMMSHNFGTKRKLSAENILGLEDELSKKKQKLALDLPGFKTPTKQSPQPEEYNIISPGVQMSSVNSSPISEKMSNIFKNLSGATNLISRSFPKPSPTESIPAKDILSTNKTASPNCSDKNSNSGKAVKSASITPPGRNKPFQLKDKPLLRMRKPKALQVLTSKVTKKAKESAKATGAELGKKSTFGVGRGRGRRPMKGPTISNLNGVLVQPPPEVFDETVKTNEYNVMTATVEDLVKYGKGITMQCLPPPPSSTQDLVNVASKYLLMEEKPTPPSFWSSDESKCGKWQRSKRDLKNFDSYEITGRMVLPDGSVKYLCSWKDGYGNAEINDEDLANEPYYEMFDDDYDDPSVVQNLVDLMDTLDTDNNETDNEEPSDNASAAVAPLIPKVEPISPSKLSVSCPKSKKPANRVNARNSIDNSSLDKDTFLVSGLGLKKKPRKENSQPDNSAQKKVEDIIDLTADSP